MITVQKWKENTFEYFFLKQMKESINNHSDKKVYLGFDYGFFSGVNIYYGSLKDEGYAQKVYNAFKKEKIEIRLYCNIDYDFDLILLFGYINNEKQRQIFKKIRKKVMRVLTSL